MGAPRVGHRLSAPAGIPVAAPPCEGPPCARPLRVPRSVARHRPQLGGRSVGVHAGARVPPQAPEWAPGRALASSAHWWPFGADGVAVPVSIPPGLPARRPSRPLPFGGDAAPAGCRHTDSHPLPRHRGSDGYADDRDARALWVLSCDYSGDTERTFPVGSDAADTGVAVVTATPGTARRPKPVKGRSARTAQGRLSCGKRKAGGRLR